MNHIASSTLTITFLSSASRKRDAIWHARDEKQIIDNSGEPFTFADGGFDGLAILGRVGATCAWLVPARHAE